MAAEGLLGQVYALGRAGEAELVCDREERAQMPELDGHNAPLQIASKSLFHIRDGDA